MENLIQDTLAKIKQQHIAPEPRWKFLARKFGAWAIVLFVVLLAAGAVSAGYYLLTQLDWEVPVAMHRNTFAYGLSVFPYFWLFVLGIAMVAIFIGVRKTETGYRFGWGKIITLALGGIILGGFVLAYVGGGSRFNGAMMNVPYYAQHMPTKESQWMQPAQGFLAGTIQSSDKYQMKLKDLNGSLWNIQMDEKTVVRPSVVLTPGQMIKIIGTKQSEQNFIAQEIRPWNGMGMMNGQGRGMMGGQRR